MIDIYVTLEEAAELESLEYHTIVMRIQRGGLYKTKKIADTINGGRERVLVSLSSLSAKARRLYRERQKVDVNKCNELDADSMPWYCAVEWGWYKEHYNRHYQQAIAMAKHVKDCVDYVGKDKTEYIRDYAVELGISERTLQRRIKDYTEASAWAIELGKDGKNYEYIRVLALCPKPRESKGRIALNAEMKALIENIWFDPDFAMNLCKYAKLYRMFMEQAELKGWETENLPSYDTVIRYIKDIRYTTDNARVLVSKGLREFKRTSMVKARRDLTTLKVMELVVADTHTFDCFVEVTSANGKKRAVKPCLVGFMDMRSRALVGWSICEIPNAQIIKETLIHMVMEKKNKANPFSGVPRILLIDNGKDYTAECLTGRSRKIRVSIDEDTKGFYTEMGIEKDMRSLPYQAWTKGQIERFFGGVCEDFTKGIKSYTGTLTGSTTGAKVKKDIKRMFERGELQSIEDFAASFEYWVLNVYSKRKHSGLKEQKEKYLTPAEVYTNEERYYKPAPPMDYLERIAMVKEHKKVYATGIKLLGCEYMAEELFSYINAQKGVTIRYMPGDVRTIKVYDAQTDRFICEARNATILNPLAPISDKTLESHIKAQKRQERAAREIIAMGQLSYEKRMTVEAMENKDKAVVLPELANGKQKAVALPVKDKNYIKDKRNEEEMEKQRQAESDAWMRKQAESVFEELRRLGG